MDNHQVCIGAQNYNYKHTFYCVANSRRSTAASDSGDREPLVHKRVRTSLQRDSRDSGLTVSCRCTSDLHAHAIIITQTSAIIMPRGIAAGGIR